MPGADFPNAVDHADKIDSDIKDEAIEAKLELDAILQEVRELKALMIASKQNQNED